MKINGLKELQNELKKMKKAAQELEGTQEVPIAELFTDSFLKKHTQFSSFKEFESQEIFEKYSSIEEIPDDEMDEFVSENTNFSDWQDMLDSAGSEYAAKKLGF